MPRRKPRRAPDQGGGTLTHERAHAGHRPPAIADPAAVARMLDALRAGVPITAACDHAGISTSAHHRAMDNGRSAAEQAEKQPTQPLTASQRAYRDYRDEVLRARAATAVAHVALVGKSAVGGQLVKEETERYRNEDGEMVTKTTREYTRPDWKASKFLLQTSWSAEFATTAKSQVELTGADGGPVGIAVASEEVLTTISERLRAVQELQAAQLPGGWDPAEEDDDIDDAELVEDEGYRG